MAWVSFNSDCRESLLDLAQVRGHPQYEANLKKYVSCQKTKINYTLVPLMALAGVMIAGGLVNKAMPLLGVGVFMLFILYMIYISSTEESIASDFHNTGRKIAQRAFGNSNSCIGVEKNNLCNAYVEFGDEQKANYIKHRNDTIDQIRVEERAAALASAAKEKARRDRRYNNRNNSSLVRIVL
jgi:hypothetical protein